MILLSNTDLDTALGPILSPLEALLPVFNRMYGRLVVESVRGVDALAKSDKEKPRRLPMWYDPTRATSVPIVPVRNQGGLLFFVTTGPVKTPDWEPGQINYSQTYASEYPMALIAYWKRGDELTLPDHVRKSILTQLGYCYDWKTSSIDDQLSARIFRDLDYDFDKHTYLLHPYCGLRIEGTLTITESVCV